MPIRDDQIEELLLNAHLIEEDLIEKYFTKRSSLDLITNRAREMLGRHTDPQVQETIGKNLSECIVVKSQQEKRSLSGFLKRALTKLGIAFGKNKEITRAEILIREIKKEKK